MVTIRRYRESDFEPAARMVWDLFARFVLPDATREGAAWWSAFLSPRGANRERLRRSYRRETISFVAVDGARIAGVVMGTTEELKRLFVRERFQRRGIGRRLLTRFENECLRQGGIRYRVVAALHAVRFYERVGCKRTTGVRNVHGLLVQPMAKVLRSGGGSPKHGPLARQSPTVSVDGLWRGVTAA